MGPPPLVLRDLSSVHAFGFCIIYELFSLLSPVSFFLALERRSCTFAIFCLCPLVSLSPISLASVAVIHSHPRVACCCCQSSLIVPAALSSLSLPMTCLCSIQSVLVIDASRSEQNCRWSWGRVWHQCHKKEYKQDLSKCISHHLV